MADANKWLIGRLAILRRSGVAALFMLGALAAGVSYAATPPAGSSIGNQASATYTDASAVPRTATSNTVTTIVQQVASFTLTIPHAVSAAPGSPLAFSHQISNTGNGADTFNLDISATTGSILSTATFYIDAGCDGVADNGVAITSVGPIAAGASACFVAATTVSGTAGNGDTGSITVRAATTLAGSSFAPVTNLDSVTVTANAVISVTKSISVPSGAPGTEVTYTLTYTNTGNTSASNVVLSDVIPSGMTYVPESGVWSGGGALTDAAAGDPSGMDYDFGLHPGNLVVPATQVATAVIASVASGQSGTLTFKATVNAGYAPGTINNTGHYCYDDGAAQQPSGSTTDNCSTTGTPAGPVPFTVLQSAAVVLDDDPSTTDDDAALDDVITEAAATQGSTVLFDTVVHNNGNGTDTFNITLAAPGGSPFPPGTTFSLYKAGGVPLTDSGSDGPDTGPLAAGASFHVWVYATLPGNVSSGGGSRGLIATSVADPSKSDTTTFTLTAITPNSVDLTNDVDVGSASGQGEGSTGATVIKTNNVNPGASTTFTIYVNNTSSVADNFDMSTTTALPSGWTVTFLADGGAGNCSTTGATLSNTGTILAGANKVVCAVVLTTAGSSAGATDISFKGLSPISGATDTITDEVNVNTVRSITLTPVNSGQIFAGGSKVYSHVLANTGSVTEDSIGLADVLSGVSAGWSVVIYEDTNTNGALDGPDQVISAVTSMAPGASKTLFVKVLASPSANPGDIDVATLTATATTCTGGTCSGSPPAAPTANTTDTSTVIAGQVDLVKVQALDANCDGLGLSYSNGNITTGAIPGACVFYQITATNLGAANVTGLVVSDATPSNTRYNCSDPGAGSTSGPAAATVTVGSITSEPADCATGTVAATVGTLTPGASAVMTFNVQINP